MKLLYLECAMGASGDMLLGALVAELAMWPGRRDGGVWNPVLGAAVFDVVSKVLSVGVSWLFMRENPAMMVMVVPFVAIGYLGSVGGLFSGVKAVKELRHAGIIHE